MQTFQDKEAPGFKQSWYPWPYTEGLTIEEANNELTFLVTGMYGKPALKQMGAPLRLAVPWKYGFKSVKSIVRFEFTDKRPKTFWEGLQAAEYGFWANVNPEVPHPRWSQATEEDIGTKTRRPTVLFNGYGEYVAGLYKGTGEGAAVGVILRSQLAALKISFAIDAQRRKNRALAGPVLVLPTESAITFQRGTAGCIAIVTWEEQRPCAYSAREVCAASRVRTTRMPHVSHAAARSSIF